MFNGVLALLLKWKKNLREACCELDETPMFRSVQPNTRPFALQMTVKKRFSEMVIQELDSK